MILEYLTSINKISIIAFIATLAYLVYEFRLLRKERERQVKPEIPSFDQGATPIPIETAQIVTNEESHKRSNYHKVMLAVLVVMLVFFGITSIVGLFRSKSAQNTGGQSRVVVQEVRSTGIKLFDAQWVELKNDTISTVKPGDLMYIGVANIQGTDIDKARIRVNKAQWPPDAITEKFDQKHNVFYMEYTISTGESRLQIEGQLHSKTDGWLSE